MLAKFALAQTPGQGEQSPAKLSHLETETDIFSKFGNNSRWRHASSPRPLCMLPSDSGPERSRAAGQQREAPWKPREDSLEPATFQTLERQTGSSLRRLSRPWAVTSVPAVLKGDGSLGSSAALGVPPAPRWHLATSQGLEPTLFLPEGVCSPSPTPPTGPGAFP